MGKPPTYETPEQLQEMIDDYFSQSDVKQTISGLSFHLGFSSRQSFYDLEKKEEFTYTIKRARLRLEIYYELLLTSNRYPGAIFALKNFGWKDTQQIDYQGKVNIDPIEWVGGDEDR